MSPQGAVPAKILQAITDLFSSPLTGIFNNLIVDCAFPDNLKLAEISPLYKKHDDMRKQNYRPISLLPAVSKVFERTMYYQLFDYIGTFLSPLFGGSRKGYNTQHVLLNFFTKL